MSEILDVLMVGCGRIAGGFDEAGDGPVRSHAGAYRADGRFRLAACVEPDGARRAAFMAAWNVPLGFATLAEALAAGVAFDVASVCSPTADHARDLATLLAARPRAVFCEKPVAASAAQARAAVEAYAAAGVPLAVNHLRRFDSRVHALKAELEAGIWGRVRSLVGLYDKGIVNNGSHMVDLVAFLCGMPRPVAAVARRDDGAADDPTVDAVLRLADGTAVHLATADAGDYAVFELVLVAERGVLALEDSGFRLRLRRPRPSPRFAGYRDLDAGESGPTGLDGAMVAAVANLHEATVAGAPLISDGHSALAAQEVCEALRRMAA